MNLYHYFEREIGAFKNLSDLSIDDATKIQNNICKRGNVFASKRNAEYLSRRRELENLARNLFIQKGGKPIRLSPHYMVVGACDFLSGWYIDGQYIKLPIFEFDVNTISFSYGDMFPTFSPLVNDGKEYRKKIYTYDEIIKVIQKYGLPQEWNKDGKYGPERYVEVQLWSDSPISKYYT